LIGGVIAMTINTQALTELLTILWISVAVVIVLCAGIVAAEAAWRRYDRKRHVRAIERYLAFMAGRRHRAPSR
jgi:hypothetical protein